MNVKSCFNRTRTAAYLCAATLLASGSLSAANKESKLSSELTDLLDHLGGKYEFLLPDSDKFDKIPQDFHNNPITAEKVALGKLLFHETAVGTDTPAADREETYSCATCHHAAAGFKAGIPQGIGDGGSGFANDGATRRVARGLNPTLPDGDPLKPDFQPVTSPAVLNAAYQPVMLWDGALGNGQAGINSGAENLITVGPPNAKVNEFELDGLETQVLAGTKVHRLSFDNSILQSNDEYRALYNAAFPSGDTGFIPQDSVLTEAALGVAKAIAAYERTILANKAPFQLWLRGDKKAMNSSELKGAILFFGKANCASCHNGPALSSKPDASADEMFFNVGFDDFQDKKIAGTVPDNVKRGRGNFTGNSADDFKFKVPQLYNMKDTRVFGHGASFKSVKQVIRYKNRARPQKRNTPNLASEFTNLNLSNAEMKDLTNFIEDALYDPDLSRYQPASVPSGNCFPAADFLSAVHLKCW